jgi:hypothetical protein
MTPIMALRMVDIHSNAARVLPKPTLPSDAKMTRTIIRRPKRAITWADLSCCGKFGSCAKFQNPDGWCVLRGPRDRIAGIGTQQADISSFASLSEVVG